VPRNHNPFYSVFGEWEYTFYDDFIAAKLIDAFAYIAPSAIDYTWFSRDGNGFRFDFIFISADILANLTYASHIHEPRINKLSDHSAVAIKLTANDTQNYPT